MQNENDYTDQVKGLVGVLRMAYNEIDENVDHPELSPLREKVLRELDRSITSISIQHNLPYEAKYEMTPIQQSGGPITKIMGRVVSGPATVLDEPPFGDRGPQASPLFQTAKEVEEAEFIVKAKDLYTQFVGIEPEALLDEYDDLIIRGVGKLAGLPVTENNPKRVNAQFVQQIKDAILAKNKLDAGDAGANDENEFTENPDQLPDETGKVIGVDLGHGNNSAVSTIDGAGNVLETKIVDNQSNTGTTEVVTGKEKADDKTKKANDKGGAKA